MSYPKEVKEAVNKAVDAMVLLVAVSVALWSVGRFWVILVLLALGWLVNIAARFAYEFYVEWKLRKLEGDITSALAEASKEAAKLFKEAPK